MFNYSNYYDMNTEDIKSTLNDVSSIVERQEELGLSLTEIEKYENLENFLDNMMVERLEEIESWGFSATRKTYE